MIILKDVSKSYTIGKTETVVFRNVSLALPSRKRIVLLGHRSAGKTTLIRLMAGSTLPETGNVERLGRISFPVGFTSAFKGKLSIRSNLAFAARVYGASVRDVISVVDQCVKLGDLLDTHTASVPGPIRKKIGCALAYAIPFDIYLIDNDVEQGDKEFRTICKAMFLERMKTSGMIIATSDQALAKEYAEHVGIISDGGVKMFATIEDAIAAFEACAPADSPLMLRKKRILDRRREREEEKMLAEEEEDEDMFR